MNENELDEPFLTGSDLSDDAPPIEPVKIFEFSQPYGLSAEMKAACDRFFERTGTSGGMTFRDAIDADIRAHKAERAAHRKAKLLSGQP